METKIVITESVPRGDLTDAAKAALARDGAHLVYHEGDLQLTANVSHGQIVGWTAHDKGGRTAPVVVISDLPNSGVSTHTRKTGYLVCACYAGGDACWWVWF